MHKLHDKPIAFPDVKTFAELFPEAREYVKDSPPILTVPAWESGTWSDRGRKTQSYLGSYCAIGGEGFEGITVKPSQAVIDFYRDRCLHCSWDTMTFQVHVWDDGRALVCLEHGQIIGSHYLAIIDAKTIPTFKTEASK